MVEIGAVASDATNLSSKASSTTDLSYARQRSNGADVQEVSMSFDDFLDMINPLEHIPVISSVYRAIADEKINPVSHIVGDTLYAGPLGLASVGLSAVGAIGDEIVAANNDGQGISGIVLASLFGDDKAQSTQAASADNADSAAATQTISAAETPAANLAPAVAETAAAPTASADAPAQQAAASDTQNAPQAAPVQNIAQNSGAKGLPLDRAKLPYGGVMDTSMMASAQQNQALALALAGQRNILASQRMMRNNRFETQASTAPATASTQAAPETETAMQNLLKELQAAKSAGLYQNASQITPQTGASVDLVN